MPPYTTPARAAGLAAAEFDLIVIGAGFAGMLAAIEARRRGIDDVLILEKGSDFGGCWRENSSTSGVPHASFILPLASYHT